MIICKSMNKSGNREDREKRRRGEWETRNLTTEGSIIPRIGRQGTK